MRLRSSPNHLSLAYLSLYLAFAAATARAIFELSGDRGFPVMLALLGGYLALLVFESPLIARKLGIIHVISAAQTFIALLLLLFIGNVDYFSLLFIPPCTQSILNLPRKQAQIWIGSIVIVMVAALLASFPFKESIGYVIIYPTALFLFAGLSYLAKQASEARDQSELLLADLQKANQQLQAYADQVKELAATNERNRLARELHDSVTQIIFGLTLSAQAARILLTKDPKRVAGELDHLQELAKNALVEMRALVQELRPSSSITETLTDCLQRIVRERKTTDGLSINLEVIGDRTLPEAVKSELYRVVQEATQNIVKHARTNQASITLELNRPNAIRIIIADQGRGFDLPSSTPQPGHLGLTSMKERVEALGGNLEIESAPGKGTRLIISVPLAQEESNVR